MTGAGAPCVIIWGAADVGKPRTRLLIEALRTAPGWRVKEITADLWGGVEDKSVRSKGDLIVRFLRLALFLYPALVVRFMAAPRASAVVVPYFGLLDVIALAPFACLKRVPIVWDAFLSLYDTAVIDRRLVKPGSLAARTLFAIEGAAIRAAAVILLDTATHAEYFTRLHPAAAGKTKSVPVGAEAAFFAQPLVRPRAAAQPFTVLFYGQFIPLHGAETIVEAARLTQSEEIEWRIIGDGQEAQKITEDLRARPVRRLRWERWVPYADLPARIAQADLCLGIFGAGEKPAAVIPNKIFQAAAMGKAFVTRDSAAIREFFSPQEEGVYLVPPRDPSALADAVLKARADGADRGRAYHAGFALRAGPAAIAEAARSAVLTAARDHCLRTLPLGAGEPRTEP